MPKCPHCGKELTASEVAALLGALGGKSTSEAKTTASRKNGAKGGRPKKEQPKA